MFRVFNWLSAVFRNVQMGTEGYLLRRESSVQQQIQPEIAEGIPKFAAFAFSRNWLWG